MTITEVMFGFKGRIARLTYFGFSMALTAVFGGLIVGGMVSFDSAGSGVVLACSLFLVGVVGAVWSGLALAVKRLHDLDLSGYNVAWIMGLNVAGSVVGQASNGLAIAFNLASIGFGLWLIFAPGQSHANGYGPVPGSLTTSAAAPTVAA
jgi:uncharacterized membrane protein YhaH (DUF805 family)